MAAPAHSTTLSRRLFLASGTAAAVFDALHASASPREAHQSARAGDADVTVFAQIARIRALHATQQALARAETEEGEDAFGEAVAALDVAQNALLDMEPETLAGLSAAVSALVETGGLDDPHAAANLAAFVLESPALKGI